METVNSLLNFICKELYLTFKLIFPIYLFLLCFQIVLIIPTIFVGQIGDGKTALAAVTLCYPIVSSTGWAFSLGLSSSLDTLASQAHGAADHKRLGILIQRSMLIHLFLIIPIAIIWINIDNILIILNQQPELVLLAEQYMNTFILIIPAVTILLPSMKILQMQHIVIPSAIILACGVGLDIVLCYLFVFVMEMGITGAALGQVLVMYAMAFAHLIYHLWKRMWRGWSWGAWEKWGQYFYYGIPVYLTNVNELIAIMLGGFVVGMVSDQPDVEISVYSIMGYLNYLLYHAPLSLSTVAAIRIGNLIGEGDIGRVKKVAGLYIITQVVISTILSIILVGGRWVWGAVFSSDRDVISGVADVIFILAIFHPLDSLVVVFQGILRGLGKQRIALLLAFVFAIVAYPLSIGLSVGLRLLSLGYLLGIMLGYMVRAFVCFFIALCLIKRNTIRRVDSQTVQENKPLLRRSSQSSELVESVNSQHSISHPSQTDTNSRTHPVTSIYLSPISRFIPMIKKIISFLILILTFIIILSCKLGSRRLSVYIHGSYLQKPLELCCFSLIPFRNYSQ